MFSARGSAKPQAGAINSAMKLDIGSALARSGMTQSALADAIGVKKGFMSEIISGKKSPSLENLTLIAQALRVRVGDLFTDAAPAAPEPKAPTAPPPPPGMADQAVPFDWPAFRSGTQATDAVEAAKAGLRHPQTYRITGNIPSLLIQAGDILVIDMARIPRDGDLALVNSPASQRHEARVSIRRMTGQLAISAEPGEPEPIIDLATDTRPHLTATICAIARLMLPDP